MTDNGGSTPPQGWYQDPSDGRMLRWWNGSGWTEHTSPMPAARPDPRHAVGEERSVARWARHGVVAYAFLTVIAGALLFRMMTGFREMLAEAMANPEAPTAFTPADPFFGMSPAAMTLLQLVNTVQLALLVLLLIWVYRAAAAAKQLGLPAPRSPGWAVASWFIPVVNLWWPYQSLRDLLPQGHEVRHRVLLLWLGWIAGTLIATGGLIMWMFGMDVGLYVGALGYLASASALLAGRAYIDEVLQVHEALVASGGLTG